MLLKATWMSLDFYFLPRPKWHLDDLSLMSQISFPEYKGLVDTKVTWAGF